MLTPEELEVMDLTVQLFGGLQKIIVDGPSSDADIAEMVHHVHAIQRAVLAQSAARVYPDKFRLLGSTVGSDDHKRKLLRKMTQDSIELGTYDDPGPNTRGCPLGMRHHGCDCERLT